jgi:hypothetical protein
VDILNLESNSVALSTSYSEDTDIQFVSFKSNTEEGIPSCNEPYLSNVTDRNINNYSSIYLTDKQKFSDFLNFKGLQTEQQIDLLSFNTSLVDPTTNLYLTISSVSGAFDAVYFFTLKDQKFVEKTARIFEINIIDETDAKIMHRSKDRNFYYLNYNYDDEKFKFSLSATPESSTFKYVLDKKDNKISLFMKSNNGLFSLKISDYSLEMEYVTSNVTKNYFNVNYYIQKILPKLNTSWVSYDIRHKNSYDINPERSADNLLNNYIIHTQYSNLTGNEMPVNFLTLKNQKTNKNYNYRSNFLQKENENVPTVDNRTYYGLFTGNEQEKGSYAITTGYEFYNNDYRLEPDTYNIFFTPESLYPYKQININDLNWHRMGSIAAENPYLSDRIYKKTAQTGEITAQYLCSWLHKNRKGEYVWLDRYYHPDKTTFAEALQTTFNYSNIDQNVELFNTSLKTEEYYDVPFVYNTPEEELQATPQTIKSAVYGISFYDKRSDLVILPNTEYIYYRVGDEYVKSVLKTITDDMIENGLIPKNGNDSYVYVDDIDTDDVEYTFNNNCYSMLNNYKSVNDSHQYTISFWARSDDWSKKSGYQIIGNLNNKGLALLDDRKITPFITVQNKKKVYTFNTNFNSINQASLENEAEMEFMFIKDVYKTDHLDSYSTISTSTEFRTDYPLDGIPLITKFNSNSVLYDALGDQAMPYESMTYNHGDYIYFLTNKIGTVVAFDTTTEKLTTIPQSFATEIPLFLKPKEYINYNEEKQAILHEDMVKYVNLPQGEDVHSILKYKDGLYAFNGYRAKQFVNDTVLYIKDNILYQESFDREIKYQLLKSKTNIIDFYIDDEYNYYVLHNTNKISKFTKDRILLYSTTLKPSISTVFNGFGIIANDEIELFKIDYVREYTKYGLSSYPIILGKIKNGTRDIQPNELFLGRLDESVTNTILQDINIVSYANFLGLTAVNYDYGDVRKINYNLTNYEQLNSRYPEKNELVFKLVLQNAYNNTEKINVEIPISKDKFTSEYHHFAFRIDGIEGYISVFCDGKEIDTVSIRKGQYIFQDIVRENMAIGKTYFYNNETLDAHLGQKNYYFINGLQIKQFKMYKRALTNTEIQYHVYRGIGINDLVVSLPCDQRNELDGIDRQFKLNTTGNKSNKINLIVKNSQLTNSEVTEKMKSLIIEKLEKVLPITTTINEIQFR